MKIEQIRCPNCGQPMRKSASTEVRQDGKRLVVYVCPNRWGCGTVVKKAE